MNKSPLLIAIASAALISCNAERPRLMLTRIEPSSSDGSETPVRIVGENFFVDADPAFNAGNEPARLGFRVEIGGIALNSIRWVSSSAIDALVPKGFEQGDYSLVVHAPDGQQATLDSAFRVRKNLDALPQRIRILGAAPMELTADGSDQTQITAQVLDGADIGMPGQAVAFTSSVPGSFDTVTDSGNGDYTVRYTPAAGLIAGSLTVTATVQTTAGPAQASVDVKLLLACDEVVDSWAGLDGAVAMANGAARHITVCIAENATIVIESSLVLASNDGVTLRGGLSSRFDGTALPADEPAIKLQSSGNVVESIHLEGAPGTAVELAGSWNTVRSSAFADCGVAIAVTGQHDAVGPGNDIFNSREVGIAVDGHDGLVTGNALHGHTEGDALRFGSSVSINRGAITFNRFYENATCVRGESGRAVRIDNNTLANSGPGIVLSNAAIEIYVRNNIFAWSGHPAIASSDASLATSPPSFNDFFSVAEACSGCTLGAGNLFSDPLFADTSNSFVLSTSPKSPCIDSGVDVGDAYLGNAPDLGAVEAQ